WAGPTWVRTATAASAAPRRRPIRRCRACSRPPKRTATASGPPTSTAPSSRTSSRAAPRRINRGSLVAMEAGSGPLPFFWPGRGAGILHPRREARVRDLPMNDIRLVGFDGDDTLWRSEDYYRAAEKRYEEIIGRYIDLHDAGTLRHLLEVERRNLKVFGYGAKGMTLSMIDAAIELTDARISARDLQQVVDIGRDTLGHPVELLDGIREAVEAVAARWPVVLVTKGDLFHQEDKIARSGLADLFPRIEIRSEEHTSE